MTYARNHYGSGTIRDFGEGRIAVGRGIHSVLGIKSAEDYIRDAYRASGREIEIAVEDFSRTGITFAVTVI